MLVYTLGLSAKISKTRHTDKHTVALGKDCPQQKTTLVNEIRLHSIAKTAVAWQSYTV